MTTDNSRFADLVQRLGVRIRNQPRLYRFQTLSLVLLGYLVLIGMLILAASLSVGILIVIIATKQLLLLKIIIVPLAASYAILKSMWITLPPPDGRRITATEAPELFNQIEEIRRRLDVPALSAVLIDDNLNAAVVEKPVCLGLLGTRRYLLLGLPLFLVLSEAQFRAVLAHEFGHLSRNHSRFSGWIYRVRRSWEVLGEQASKRKGIAAGILGKFLNWYVPVLMGYTFVLARENEYEADRCAVEVAGARSSAEALLAVHAYSDALRYRYWPQIFDRVEQFEEPEVTPYAELLNHSRIFLSRSAVQQYASDALEQKTGLEDTHPCIAERISAIGAGDVQLPENPLPVAEQLLGSTLEMLLGDFDSEWRKDVASQWKQRHEYVTSSKARLSGYRNDQLDDLNEEQLLDYAELSEEFDSRDSALQLFQLATERYPGNPVAGFNLGRLLLENQDEAGIGLIEKAMQDDSDAVQPGCSLLYKYMHKVNRPAEAENYARRWHAQQEIVDKAAHERRVMTIYETYLPFEPSEADRAAILTALRSFSWIGKAYLVQKQLKYSKGTLVILGVQSSWLQFRKRQSAQLVAQALNVQQPMTIINLDKSRTLRKLFANVPDSLIYK